ncbi:MAG: MFS transporter [Candidatus Binatia bacterium]|nr:MFS transporter [Candidatus Binatia bacterium]MDG2008620.1 MFS transporter [Candidatus Binatia bacterium]
MDSKGSSAGNHGKVPAFLKFAYGSGAMAEGVKNSVFNTFLLFYYTGVLGLPGSLAGTALFLAMCFDAVSDPLVGYLSDHTRSRWGRRHPWMYAAILPMGLSVYGLLSPPAGLGETELFFWMTGLSIAVRQSLTLHMIPRNALLPEMTYDYDERTGLISISFLLGWVGGLGLTQLAWLVLIPAVPGGRMNPEAYQAIGFWGAWIAAIGMFIATAGTQRLVPQLRVAEATPLGFRAFWGEITNALRNESFRMILFGGIIVSAAANFQEVFGLYMNTYFWEFTDADIARLGLFLAVAVLVAVVATRPVTRLSDKRRTAIGIAAFLLVWGPLPVAGRLLGLLPENGSPMLLPLITVHLMVSLIPAVAMGILLGSMFMDTIDESELETGIRQEGVFGAANAFALKAVGGVGNLMGGMAIEWIDFPLQASVATVSPEKIFWLGIVAGPGMILFYVAGFFFLTRYSITRERYLDIQKQLEARRSK